MHAGRRDGIVDDNEVGATTDQDVANHARDSLPAMGEIEVAAAALGLQMRKQGSATLRPQKVGVSGTGSVVAEQLARLGSGEIILVDFDRIEGRNLDRILNSTMADVADSRLKV